MPRLLTRSHHIELQVALCKLQLLAQKWSEKLNKAMVSALSCRSAFQPALTEISSITQDKNGNGVSSLSIM